ncbi:MAG: hypothetical protein ACRYFS_15250 [Janthinobacterium lividum]
MPSEHPSEGMVEGVGEQGSAAVMEFLLQRDQFVPPFLVAGGTVVAVAYATGVALVEPGAAGVARNGDGRDGDGPRGGGEGQDGRHGGLHNSR